MSELIDIPSKRRNDRNAVTPLADAAAFQENGCAHPVTAQVVATVTPVTPSGAVTDVTAAPQRTVTSTGGPQGPKDKELCGVVTAVTVLHSESPSSGEISRAAATDAEIGSGQLVSSQETEQASDSGSGLRSFEIQRKPAETITSAMDTVPGSIIPVDFTRRIVAALELLENVEIDLRAEECPSLTPIRQCVAKALEIIERQYNSDGLNVEAVAGSLAGLLGLQESMVMNCLTPEIGARLAWDETASDAIDDWLDLLRQRMQESPELFLR